MLLFKVPRYFVSLDYKVKVICDGQTDLLVSHYPHTNVSIDPFVCVSPYTYNSTFTVIHSCKLLIIRNKETWDYLSWHCDRYGVFYTGRGCISEIKYKQDRVTYEEKWSSFNIK